MVVWVQYGCQFIGGLPSCVAAPAPHHKSITAHMLAWGGGGGESKSEILSMVSSECVSLLHHYKVKES